MSKEIDFGTLADLFRGLGLPDVSWLYRIGFGIERRQEFYKDLASILRSGIRLEEGLKEVKASKSVPDYIVRILLDRIRRGRPFSKAMEGLVPGMERMVLQAGERGESEAGVEESLLILADTVGSMKKGQAAVIKSVAYPFSLFLGVIGFVVFYARTVIPKFIAGHMLDPSKLHGNAFLMFEVFDLVKNYWLPGLFLMFGGIGGLIFSMPYDFPGRKWLDRFPPWSIYRLWVGTQFLFSMSALMRAGVPVLQSLNILIKYSNPWLTKRVRVIKTGVARGAGLSKAMEKTGYHFPDDRIISRLRIRENHADVSEALREFSRDWQERGDNLISSQTKILNVVLILVVAGLLTLAGIGPYAFEVSSGQTMTGF